ncbi:MAG: hypothetical protein ACOYT4_02400 [Nanoarchaeota archaeon]
MKPKTWNEIKTLDDIVPNDERKILEELNSENDENCPFLGKDGKYFYYCKKNLPKISRERKRLSASNPIYQAHVELAEIQLYCKGSYSNCCVYSEVIKPQVKI